MFLFRLQREAERLCKKRHEMREKLEKVCNENEYAASKLKRFNRKTTGRPRKEVDQPEMLSAIVSGGSFVCSRRLTLVQASSFSKNPRQFA